MGSCQSTNSNPNQSININKALNSISNDYPQQLFDSQFNDIIQKIKKNTNTFNNNNFNKSLMHKELKDIVKNYIKNISNNLSQEDKIKINQIASENNILKLLNFIKNNPNQNINSIYNDILGDYVTTIIKYIKPASTPQNKIEHSFIKPLIDSSINKQSGGKKNKNTKTKKTTKTTKNKTTKNKK